MSAYMLYNAPNANPYWYYQLLRWLVCFTAAIVAYYAYQWQNLWAPWLFGAIAVLFNPIVPFHFDRRAWAMVDVAAAVFMIAAAYFAEPPIPQRDN